MAGRVPPRAAGAPGPDRRRRRRRRRGREALLPPDPAGRDQRRATATCSSCPAPPTWRATTTSPGWTGSCSPATTRGSSPPPAASAGWCSRPCCGATSRRRPRLAARLQDIFGRDNLFVELQDHGLDEQRKTNPQLIDIARRIGAPLLATNDSHYTHREDAVAHDALLCVQTGSAMDDPKRFKFEGNEHYLKSAAEMRHLFSELPEACDNTLWIAERADVEIEFGKPKLPSFPRPAGLRRRRRLPAPPDLRRAPRPATGRPLPDKVVERLDYELGRHLRAWGSPTTSWSCGTSSATPGSARSGSVPGRGSAAGCCVAYCLRIVDLDPDPLRPALRALPQPRAQADARHRHGLRRALPRRDDPLRRPSARAGTTWPRS